MATFPLSPTEGQPLPSHRFLSTLQSIIQVPEKLSISEWAEKYRFLPAEEAVPGQFKFENSPWTREIADRLHPDDPCTEVVLMKSRQTGGSEAGLNMLGYCVDRHPGRFLYIMPNFDMAKRMARHKIHNMFMLCPTLRDKVATRRSSKGSSSILERDFVGGSLIVTSANSEVNLRSISVPWIIFDEFEAYPLSVDGRGDPIEIAKRTADTFGWRRKFFYPSTPLDEQISRVEPMFRKSDMNYYHVPCLKCGEFQTLIWKQVDYDKLSPHNARYQCAYCESLWAEGERIQSTRLGRWIPTREWYPHMPRGYHINAYYSHQVSLGEIAQEWIEAQGNVEQLIVWTNNRDAQTWKDQSIYTHNPESLMARRERYDYPAPHGVQVITAGVDVQDDRLEIGIYGWGWGEECWALGHHILMGDTTRWEVWHELSDLLTVPFTSPIGDLKIEAVGIDTGHHSSQVYAFCVRRDDNRTHRVYPVRGVSEPNQPIWRRTPVRNKVKRQNPYLVNTFEAKKILYARLSNQPGGPATMHFPIADWCDEDYFKQLTSETLRRTQHRGRQRMEWVMRRGHSRNEVLDCLDYAFAVLKGMITRRFRFAEQYDIAFKEKLEQNMSTGSSLPDTQQVDLAEVRESVGPSEPFSIDDPIEANVDQSKDALEHTPPVQVRPPRQRGPKRIVGGRRRYR